MGGELPQIRLIWAAILSSQFVVGLALFLAVQEAVPFDGSLHPMALPLGLVAGMMGLAAPVMRKVIMGQTCLPLLGQRNTHQSSGHIDAEALREEQVQAGARYRTGTIIGLAMAETSCLIGFALGYMAHQPILIVPFLLWSIGLILWQFPYEGGLSQLLSPAARAAIRFGS